MAPPKLRPVDPQPDESESPQDRLAAAHDRVRRLDGERGLLIERQNEVADLVSTIERQRAHLTRRAIGDERAKKPLGELAAREGELAREARDLLNAITAVDADLEAAHDAVKAAEIGLKDLSVDDLIARRIALSEELEAAVAALAPLVQQWRRTGQELAAASGDRSAQVHGGHRLSWLFDDLLEINPLLSSTKRMLRENGGFAQMERKVLNERINFKRRARDRK